MKKTILWTAVLVLFALVAWRAAHRNWPQLPGEEWLQGRHSFRGHKPQEKPVGELVSEEGGPPPAPRAVFSPFHRVPPPGSWLLGAESDWDRFQRIETVLGGMDICMLEIGLRCVELHDAIASDNFGLAEFQAGKIRSAADTALLRSPEFRADAGLDYLGKPQWEALRAAVSAKNGPAAREAYLAVRQTCLRCHTERKMEFLNGSEVFRKTDGFPSPAPESPAQEPAKKGGRP